jgi:hypothetical protein
METRTFNITAASSDMGTTFLNLIWNYYNEKGGICNYAITPNKDKEMIAIISFDDDEKMNNFMSILNREVKYKLVEG